MVFYYSTLFIIIAFLAGLAFCFSFKSKDVKEGFNTRNDCPNILLQSGTEILLFNNKKANIPGVNPLRFQNLNDYVEFTKWQRSMGIRCPILYLQQTYDTQNNLGWKPLKDPLDPKAGIMNNLPPPRVAPTTLLFDANRGDNPYNKGDYPGYDPDNQYIGDYTPLDKMYYDQGSITDKQNIKKHVYQRGDDAKFMDFNHQDPDKYYHGFGDYDKAKDRRTIEKNKYLKNKDRDEGDSKFIDLNQMYGSSNQKQNYGSFADYDKAKADSTIYRDYQQKHKSSQNKVPASGSAPPTGGNSPNLFTM